jgi:hypothetical protein
MYGTAVLPVEKIQVVLFYEYERMFFFNLHTSYVILIICFLAFILIHHNNVYNESP